LDGGPPGAAHGHRELHPLTNLMGLEDRVRGPLMGPRYTTDLARLELDRFAVEGRQRSGFQDERLGIVQRHDLLKGGCRIPQSNSGVSRKAVSVFHLDDLG